MFYRAKHKAKYRWNHTYTDSEHPVLFCLGCAATTLATTAIFFLIAFA